MSPTIRRLMKEAAELSDLSPSPSPHFCAHPVSDSNLFDWHFTLAGPPAPSPYAGGIYHGRIVLPPTYPLRPPSFRFLTPSGRFETNREICLSISGHHEETWQPAWGIRTALMAIRTFMDGDPKGQLGGLDAPEDVRKMWAEKSRTWSCDCMNGKTNEQVLNEWREMCARKGISIDAQDRETVPEGMKMSYKKSSVEDQGCSSANNLHERPPSDMTADPARESDALTCLSQQHHQSTPTSVPTSGVEDNILADSEITISSANTLPSTTTHSRTNRATVPQTTVVVPTSTQTSTSGDSAWLDRAIIGIIIALTFMIMRRIALRDDV